jgi:pilus assembly protein Flp/PilA
MESIKKFLRDEEGLTTVEYAIAGGLVGAAVIAAFVALGDEVDTQITNITDCLASGGAGC